VTVCGHQFMNVWNSWYWASDVHPLLASFSTSKHVWDRASISYRFKDFVFL